MEDGVLKVIDELNEFLANEYYPLLDEYEREERRLTKEKAKEFKERFEKVLKKLEEFRKKLKEHLVRLVAEEGDELASNVRNTIEFLENEMANVIRIIERLKDEDNGEEKKPVEEAKELEKELEKKVEKEEEWKEVKVEEVKPVKAETAETFDIIYQKLVTQFIYVLKDKHKLSDEEAEKVEKDYDELIKELAGRVVKGEMEETDALMEVSRIAEEYRPKIAVEAEPYVKALKDVFITNLMFYKGLSEERAKEVAEEMEKEIEKLAIDVVQGKMKYRQAVWKVVDMAKEWKPNVSKKEVIDLLTKEYEVYLAEQGVTNPKKVLEFVKKDIEDLANEVIEGRMPLEDAIERVRMIPIPPIAKFKKVVPTAPTPPAPIAPEEVPPKEKVFISPREGAELIFRHHLDDLLLFGLRYVFEQYGRKYGIPEGKLKYVAGELAKMLRNVGRELERSELGRYKIIGDFLTRYALEIVWKGALKRLSWFIMHYYWTYFRSEYPELVEALTGTGIEGCIAKAFEGVLFTALGVPRERWPEDVITCYEKMIEVIGE